MSPYMALSSSLCGKGAWRARFTMLAQSPHCGIALVVAAVEAAEEQDTEEDEANVTAEAAAASRGWSNPSVSVTEGTLVSREVAVTSALGAASCGSAAAAAGEAGCWLVWQVVGGG